jgi:hypothetical protein
VARSARLAIVGAFFVAAVVGAFFAVRTLLWQPATIAFSANSTGEVNLTLQTVGSIGYGDHPTWVTYMIQTPSGQWVHSTIFQVPAHTRVNVTIDQFDSGSPLRNQQFGQVEGTIGDDASLNGKTFKVIDSNNPNTGGVGHTFAIPVLRLSVPLAGVTSSNVCAEAPCQTSSTAYGHNIVKFSFMTPGPGSYAWQCFVPCGLGWLYGNGGPMQTLGYMGGFMKVV